MATEGGMIAKDKADKARLAHNRSETKIGTAVRIVHRDLEPTAHPTTSKTKAAPGTKIGKAVLYTSPQQAKKKITYSTPEGPHPKVVSVE